MLNEETRRKLRMLNMAYFIDEIDNQKFNEDIISLSFEERFQILIDAVYQKKYNEKVIQLIKSAKLRLQNADLHDFYYTDTRPINRNTINDLLSCSFIEQNKSIIIQGYTSSGKTFLGCALAKEACRHEYRTKYIRLPDLLTEYAEYAFVATERLKFLKKYAAFKVLVIDEWLVNPISQDEVRFLFELSERRYDSSTTIFCTLFRKEDWVKNLGEGVMAESIVERFNHNVITLETGQLNMRSVFEAKK